MYVLVSVPECDEGAGPVAVHHLGVHVLVRVRGPKAPVLLVDQLLQVVVLALRQEVLDLVAAHTGREGRGEQRGALQEGRCEGLEGRGDRDDERVMWLHLCCSVCMTCVLSSVYCHVYALYCVLCASGRTCVGVCALAVGSGQRS